MFDPASVTAFRVTGATLDAATGEARFSYELAGAVPETFTETVRFQLPEGGPQPDALALANRVLPVLAGALGLSYYKVAAPPRIEVAIPGLTAEAVAYLGMLIREGLAEFAYRAQLPGLLEPEIVADLAPAVTEPRAPAGDPLVPIGGGKDSVVTVESLGAAGLRPVQFAVNPNRIIRRVAEVAGRPLVEARRTLDPRLLELNAEGALNGHVPVTAFNSLIAIVQSALLGLGPVVMSNESSASDPTLEWDGRPVNHQWSKGLDAERALIGMLRAQAGLTDAYFSLLRPFSELRIARGFARLSAYDAAIVSCNRAFRIQGAEPTWCGDCPKCRFVFLAFAPYMEPERLAALVGTDLFADPGQTAGFRELVGLDAHKPFECVGEEAESSLAVGLVAHSDAWLGRPVIAALLAEAPELRDGDAALEATVFGDADAVELPDPYETARYALV